MTTPAQPALFDADPAAEAPATGVPTGRFDPAAYDVALAGDGYGWLADLLPASQPPACEGCEQPMSVPATAPVLWACPACHPQEDAA